jgi:hypothetical protein
MRNILLKRIDHATKIRVFLTPKQLNLREKMANLVKRKIKFTKQKTSSYLWNL